MNPESRRDWRVDIIEFLSAIARRKLLVVSIMTICVMAGFTAAICTPPFYEASSTIVLLPREKPVLDLSVQSQLVETAGDEAKRSPSATLSLPPNPDLYTTLIRSGAVTQRVADALHDDPDLANEGRLTSAKIREGLAVQSTDEGVLRIEMRHRSPRLAAAVVNALVKECEHASKAIERQLIVQQAGYLASAIAEAQLNLDRALERLVALSARSGVSDPSAAAGRSASLIQTLDDTEARLGRERERLLVYRTEIDPQVVAIEAELCEVRSRREGTQEMYCGNLSQSEYAQFEADWAARDQDVSLRRDVLMSMRARHDVFKIRAEQPAGNIAVIRPAAVPAAPAGPSKRKFLVLAALSGGLIACAASVAGDQLDRVRKDDAMRTLLASLLQHLLSIRRTEPLRKPRIGAQS